MPVSERVSVTTVDTYMYVDSVTESSVGKTMVSFYFIQNPILSINGCNYELVIITPHMRTVSPTQVRATNAIMS